MLLAGKRAVVTGSASGIGRATAHALSRAGACVVVADIDRAGGEATCAALAKAGGKAHFEAVDLTERASIEALADAVLARGGPPDVLVNAAGWDRFEPFVLNDLDFIEGIVRLNLLGPVVLTRTLLPADRAPCGRGPPPWERGRGSPAPREFALHRSGDGGWCTP